MKRSCHPSSYVVYGLEKSNILIDFNIFKALLFLISLICRELPFQKGDIVYIIRQVDQNWYEGEHHGRVGIFPQSYVEVSEFSLDSSKIKSKTFFIL